MRILKGTKILLSTDVYVEIEWLFNDMNIYKTGNVYVKSYDYKKDKFFDNRILSIKRNKIKSVTMRLNTTGISSSFHSNFLISRNNKIFFTNPSNIRFGDPVFIYSQGKIVQEKVQTFISSSGIGRYHYTVNLKDDPNTFIANKIICMNIKMW